MDPGTKLPPADSELQLLGQTRNGVRSWDVPAATPQPLSVSLLSREARALCEGLSQSRPLP